MGPALRASPASPRRLLRLTVFIKSLEELRVRRLRAVTLTQGRAQVRKIGKKTELLPEDKEKQKELHGSPGWPLVRSLGDSRQVDGLHKQRTLRWLSCHGSLHAGLWRVRMRHYVIIHLHCQLGRI